MKNGFTLLSSISRGTRRGSLLFLSFGMALLFLTASSARANTWTVNTLQDSTDSSCSLTACSLRDAITVANTDMSGNVLINFSVTGTITLTNTLPAITNNMAIQGPGANGLTISGDQKYGFFNIKNRAGVRISGLTFAYGHSYEPIYIFSGALAVSNSTFSGNFGIYGGVFYNQATLTLVNCTFRGNLSSQGGVIYNKSFARIFNTTFYGNEASVSFGGYSAGEGGVIYNDGYYATVSVYNSIFNRNTAQDGALIQNGQVNHDYDLFFDNIGGIGVAASTNDVRGADADPKLLPLGNYGGPTETMMPQVGSAAICNGDTSDLTNMLSFLSLPLTDQRGWPTTPSVGECTNGNIDIGSVQTNYLLVTNTDTSGGGSLPYEASLANASGGHDIGFSLGTSPTTILLDSPLSLSSGETLFLGLPDAVTISGGNSTQILSLSSSGDASAILHSLTLQDGSGTDGGALDNEGTGTLTVFSSTLSGNQATDEGGAIENGGTGTLVVTNSTFSGNSVGSGGFGGAVHNGSGALNITNSTFSGNWAGTNSAPGDGGAIYDTSGTLVLADNIVSGNSAGGSGTGGVFYGGSSITENHNLFYDNGTGGDASGFDPSSTPTDVTGTSADPKLASLGNYGGPTQTMLPLPGSPAMCEGTTTLPSSLVLPASDQRGFPRTTRYPSIPTTCADIGAVQAHYTSIQFTNVPAGGYTAIEHQAINPPAPNTSVTEQGVASVDGVPLTLSLNPVPNPPATGVMAMTADGSGATFGSLTVDIPGSYHITSTLKTTTLNTSITAPARSLTILSYEQADINYISTITTLSSGQVNSMDRELNKAYSMALDGKFKGAINNLEDFISEVNDLSSSGVLTNTGAPGGAGEAGALLGFANDAISLYEQGLL